MGKLKFEFETPKSTVISKVRYSSGGGNLRITFRSGNTHRYPNTSKVLATRFRDAVLVDGQNGGGFFNKSGLRKRFNVKETAS